ncbi:hypothetical protein MRB53_001901 [Persea americana]|uniref:Uncharacterized protein n=1 Tax=Persea americana TaxID=3435 RepID=A0ACC2MTC8_PERAE|nr:hypothetical protein MRB53_001901 [Persea americana]
MAHLRSEPNKQYQCALLVLLRFQQDQIRFANPNPLSSSSSSTKPDFSGSSSAPQPKTEERSSSPFTVANLYIPIAIHRPILRVFSFFDRTGTSQEVVYIKVLRKMGRIEKLRNVRESMSALFPLSPKMWQEWAKDEASLSDGSAGEGEDGQGEKERKKKKKKKKKKKNGDDADAVGSGGDGVKEKVMHSTLWRWRW